MEGGRRANLVSYRCKMTNEPLEPEVSLLQYGCDGKELMPLKG